MMHWFLILKCSRIVSCCMYICISVSTLNFVFYMCFPQGDKKLRCDSADLRHDIDRRRKERSKERGDSKGSRESSGSRKQEKPPKDYKEYKSYKDDR